ncbi:probable disease resistance protein At5g63020 [Typha latifolia]|uniref:probable disease resistance protein At5g63020 n=1 Tax=Typha latifolia TaxID=4733 RepID=UPI003C2CC0A0
MEPLCKVADVIMSPLFNFVKQQLKYFINAADNMRDLESNTRRLIAKEKDAQVVIEATERKGKTPSHQLLGWLDEVEATKADVDAMVEKYKERFLCLNCFSPNCWSNYSLSKTAAEKLVEVRRLLEEGEKLSPTQAALTPAQSLAREEPMLPSSPNPNLEEALRCIKEDQEVGMIGIWGMGGAGKTHLLKQINNFLKGDSAFEPVILVTASQSCTTETIQMQIVTNLNLQQSNDATEQRNIIFKFLKNKSFVLLLDDLWARLDLQDVGIPFPLGVVGECTRKVVLTTRLETVCGDMEVRRTIKMECLNYDDALKLFLDKVGTETINSHPRIPSLAEDVVKELEGLPLALITIGRSMYPKKDPKQWEYAINLLKKSRLHEVEKHSPEDLQNSTFYRLKFSYDNLKSDTLRECFLSCSMWPEDFLIKKEEDLIKCWMGLGLIEVFDHIADAYNTGHELIGDLIGACLLEDHEGVFPSVRMHDVLRDMALWIVHDQGKNKNKWMVFEHEAPRDQEIWHKAERITLIESKIEALPPIATAPSSSKLTTLMLSGNRKLRELGDNFGALVALTYLDLSLCGFVHFPKEICGLVQLQYLNLAHNRMPSLPEELGSLVNLKFLILRDTGIHAIPQGVIAKLKSLQVLDLYHSWGTIDKYLTDLASQLLEELECLNNLKGLGICIEDTSQLNRLVELPNVSVRWLFISTLENSTSFSLSTSFLGDKQIQINLAEIRFINCNVTQVVLEGNHQHPTCHLRALETFKIEGLHCLEEIIWKGVVPEELFQALRELYVSGCDNLKSISWVLHLPCLTSLMAQDCSSMRELIADTVEKEEEKEITSTPTFRCLREIYLEYLPEMVSICHSAFAFPALCCIYVHYCPKLKKLPFRPGNIPSKLLVASYSKGWWEGLEWEDSSVKTSIQLFDKEEREVSESKRLIFCVLP